MEGLFSDELSAIDNERLNFSSGKFSLFDCKISSFSSDASSKVDAEIVKIFYIFNWYLNFLFY